MTLPRTYFTNHAKHAGYCSCGKVVHGNGGKAGHAYMHERRQDGHTWLTQTRYRERFPIRGETP